jgi:N-acetylneuraminic acid mutarotase
MLMQLSGQRGLPEVSVSLAMAVMAFSASTLQAATAEHPATDTPAIAPLPKAVASFGAAVTGHWLYVLGGHVGEEHHHSAANLSSFFMRLNLLDRTTWEILPGGVGLQSVALVAHEGRVFRIGGMRALNDAGEPERLESVAEVACFDPSTRTWKPLPDLPEARSSHDAVVHEGKIYVAGGWTLNGASDDARWLNTAHVLDLAKSDPKWESLPAAPFQRRAAAVTAADGKLYVIGGIGTNRKPSKQVDVLDLRAGKWSAGPELADNGFGAAAASMGNQVYLSGLDGVVHKLDAGAQRWVSAGRLMFPRFFHRLLPAGSGELLAVGGAARGGHLRQIESIDLTEPSEGPVVSVWTLPFAGASRNRQGMFLHDNQLYLFGGNNSLEQHDFEPENFLAEGYGVHLGGLRIEPRADFPVKRQSMGTALVNGPSMAGYAIGGFGHDGDVARSFDDAYRYDFKEDAWRALGKKLPAPITQFGLVSEGSTLWIFGGLDYDPRREREDRFRHSSQVLAWDTLDEAAGFEPIATTLPQPRRAFGCAAIGDKVYLVGGMRESFKTIEACDVFDLKSRTWTTIPSPRRPRISPEMVAIDGRLYLVGGSSPDADGEIGPNESIEVFEPATGAWTEFMNKLPLPARQLRALAAGDHLMLSSTHDERPNVLHMAMIKLANGKVSTPLVEARR